MARPLRAEAPASNLLQVKLTDRELGDLDALRLPGESRSAAVRRLLRLGEEPHIDPPPAPAPPTPSVIDGIMSALRALVEGGAVPVERPRRVERWPRAALLVDALERTGYTRSEAEGAIDALGDRVATESIPDLVRAAIAELDR